MTPEKNSFKEVVEKEAKSSSGFAGIILVILLFLLGIGCFVTFIYLVVTTSGNYGSTPPVFYSWFFLPLFILSFVFAGISSRGIKTIGPNEAYVLLLFGDYYGTLSAVGFHFVNPFCRVVSAPFTRGKISLKAITMVNEKQKVNDLEGNPIEIGVIVVWRVINTTKAVFSVENYTHYISTQADSAIRQVARTYPYDAQEGEDEKTLRGSSVEISKELTAELQHRVDIAGIEILEVRINHLAYSPEIAQAMLQRQQARAIIDARQKIVEGAVSMVEMAINKLEENNICKLDAEKKAMMVANLLVVLCGNKDASPVVNTGI